MESTVQIEEGVESEGGRRQFPPRMEFAMGGMIRGGLWQWRDPHGDLSAWYRIPMMETGPTRSNLLRHRSYCLIGDWFDRKE